MTLKVVEKGRISTTIHLAEIGDVELSSLKSPNTNAVTKQKHLALLHGKYWIGCDCNNKDTPYLTIRKSINSYHLVNLNGHGRHLKTCSLSTENIKSNEKPVEYEIIDNYISLEHTPSSNNHLISSDECTIFPLLLKILCKAGFDSISSKHNYNSNVLSLLDMGIEGVSFNSKPLPEIFNLGYGHFNKHKQSILDGIHKELLICDVMDEYVDDGKSLLFKKHYTKKFFTSFRFYKSFTQIDLVSNSKTSMCKGPYFVLSNLKDISSDKGKTFIAPSFVAVIPVSSKSQWCVVNNDHERQVVEQLLKSLAWYHDKTEYDCIITKPFYPVQTSIGLCHPDFIVGDAPVKQVIEVMGDNTRRYEAQKLASHIVMSSIGEVSVYDPFNKSKSQQNEHCFNISKMAITKSKFKKEK